MGPGCYEEWGREPAPTFLVFELIRTGGGEAHQHTAIQLLTLTTTAIMGTLYIDGGMKAVTSFPGSYADYMAQVDSGR